MDIEIIRGIVEKAIKDAFSFGWWEYSIAIGILISSGFLSSYFNYKGKNFATKEDIANLTDIVEAIKFEYSNKVEELNQQNRIIIEKMNYKHQLKLAALEKRLEAHQKAYSFWRKLLEEISYQKHIDKTVMECQTWWESNCLYLSSNVRSSFQYAFSAAFKYNDLNEKEKAKELKRIKLVGDLIVSAVELPTIGEKESEVLIRNEEA